MLFLLSRNLWMYEFQMLKLKLSLRILYGRHYELVGLYEICFTDDVATKIRTNLMEWFFSVWTYNLVCAYISNTTDETCWAGSSYPSGELEFFAVSWWAQYDPSLIFAGDVMYFCLFFFFVFRSLLLPFVFDL